MHLFSTVGCVVVSIGGQIGPPMPIIETISVFIWLYIHTYIYIYVYSFSSYLHKYIALWVKLRWHAIIDVNTLLKTMPSISCGSLSSGLATFSFPLFLGPSLWNQCTNIVTRWKCVQDQSELKYIFPWATTVLPFRYPSDFLSQPIFRINQWHSSRHGDFPRTFQSSFACKIWKTPRYC